MTSLCNAHLGWGEAAEVVRGALERVIASGVVTEDLAKQMGGETAVSTSGFTETVVRKTGELVNG